MALFYRNVRLLGWIAFKEEAAGREGGEQWQEAIEGSRLLYLNATDEDLKEEATYLTTKLGLCFQLAFQSILEVAKQKRGEAKNKEEWHRVRLEEAQST